jgi:hypothetical protein
VRGQTQRERLSKGYLGFKRLLAGTNTSDALVFGADQAVVERGDFHGAIAEYRQAIQADPTYRGPQFNLALLLAICPDEQLIRTEKEGVARTGPKAMIKPTRSGPRLTQSLCAF